jgi:hypothetical protein
METLISDVTLKKAVQILSARHTAQLGNGGRPVAYSDDGEPPVMQRCDPLNDPSKNPTKHGKHHLKLGYPLVI